MIFSLDVRRAGKGDCLLLHYGSTQEPGLVMIDGGPNGIYRRHLRPRLDEIRRARRLGGNEPLLVDLLVVSHLDADHVQGILDLTRELQNARLDNRPPIVKVLSFWHNSFDEIIDRTPDELTTSVRARFGPASLSGATQLPEEERSQVEEEFAKSNPEMDPEEGRELVSSTLKVLASIGQGFQLRVDARALQFPLNSEFDGKLIVAAKRRPVIDMGRELRFTVAGPMKGELEALRKKHNKWLKKVKDEGKPLPSPLAAYVDKSVPNLSSLVLLAECSGKTMLLTGDARGDRILQGLELVDVMKKGGNLHVDLLKVPHHGSANNLETGFFERITADHYVFSGNGEYGNPERQALEMLFKGRGNSDYLIHFTYPIDEIDIAREADWNRQQAHEKTRKKKNPEQVIRPNWSAAEHSLRAFVDQHAGLEDKIMIVDEDGAHVINLMEPLTF